MLHMTVAQLLDSVSSSELTEWQAMFELWEQERLAEMEKIKARRG